jgi:hypothetical protein
VLVGLISDHTTPLSYHFDPCNVCSWDIVACIRATSASMFHLIGFRFPVMWCFMKDNFRLPLPLIHLPHPYLNTSFFLHCMPLFLMTNMLYGLHYPLCIMVLTLAQPASSLLTHVCRNMLLIHMCMHQLLIPVFPHLRCNTMLCQTSYNTRVPLLCMALRCRIKNSSWAPLIPVKLSLMPYNSPLHRVLNPHLHDRAQDFRIT